MTYGAITTPTVIKTALEFVYPPLCLGCGDYHPMPGLICERCRKAIDRETAPSCLLCLQPLQHDLTCQLCLSHGLPLLTLGTYAFPTDQIVGQMKYYGIRRAAALYGDYLSRAHASSLVALQVEGLVPIPLHPTRFFSRGYNQSELLARAVSESTGLPVRTDILRRVKWRRPQTQVGYKKRSKNVRGVFVADPAGPPTRLAIVDDVVTTGSTVLQARSALEDAGQTVVAVLAIAGGGG